MVTQLRELYSLLSPGQRRRLLRLQGLIIVMAFAEIASVIAIGPFMAVVGDMSRLQGEGWLAQAYRLSGFDSPERFLSLLGVSVLAVLLVAAMFSMYTTWRLSLYGAQVGAELSSRLYRYYLHQPWLFHAGGSSSRLINRASQEVQRVTNRVINPFMQLNAKLVMVTCMSLTIFLYNPVVAASGILIFIASYLLLYKTVRRFLISNGRRVSRSQAKRFKLMTEGFGGIKDLLLLRRQATFTTQFDRASQQVARGQGVTQGLSEAPRYAIEMVAFGSVILLVLYLLNSHQGNLGTILPALSIYALAGFKMLPAYQKMYGAISHIRGNLAAYESIREDLIASQAHAEAELVGTHDKVLPLVPQRSIRLEEVHFHYPGKRVAALNGLNLTIPVGARVGLVGASGSGKSTAVDLLLGLIQPQQGRILVDERPLTEETLPRWQACIGFVPQHIFLADATILENVAFGVPREEIDAGQVEEAVRMAQLDELLASLPDGLETYVGERGVQLSGGQRQRIGIARALYRNAQVLVLDEATSALDGITEQRVMADIAAIAGGKTLVMIAHRLTTVKDCDVIHMVDQGRVTDSGTYDELVARNVAFRMMANL
ncbi:MAG: ABC transporter ATP-binding protein/permease [Halomonas sp.]|jgi:ABC-type multidrug transport system fused ATPase/permease subunit|uniref:ABC transporter ATP-binding protein n=1 Tax=Billgrantia tianxiuensis TaxID=2497861 RepID=A0A6I6SDI6_9GAMM|nr:MULTISPECIES: ABC transporter ATP-binding protein [Halomonas]MCE8035048.1 ABC transporter ATP-binding protein [Halomonas sp. MCCC 1A11057]MDX5434713.1 ABC transporter ATP-binding protein/permease [Halomonas sp.]QHC48449.1 ABC transporter ATP-binding protein [Halomonas tianxiuensis]